MDSMEFQRDQRNLENFDLHQKFQSKIKKEKNPINFIKKKNDNNME